MYQSIKQTPKISNIVRPVHLAYKSYFFSQRIIFFSHNKSANSTFSHGLSAKRTGHKDGGSTCLLQSYLCSNLMFARNMVPTIERIKAYHIYNHHNTSTPIYMRVALVLFSFANFGRPYCLPQKEQRC